MTVLLGGGLLIRPALAISQLAIDADKAWPTPFSGPHVPAWALPGWAYRKRFTYTGTAAGWSTFQTKTVTASADDSAGFTGTYDRTATQQILGKSGGSARNNGFIFRAINIPVGATITSAYIRFTAEFSRAGQNSHQTIKGENHAIPAAYGAIEDFTTRPYLGTTVAYNPEASWTLDNQYFTPDISAIITALFGAYGPYVNGVIAFEFADNASANDNYQVARSYDSDPTKVAQLFITYTVPRPAVNYQVQLTLVEGPGIDSGGTVYTQGLCNANFSDIRVTNAAGAPLDYWIQSYTAGTTATVWVELDSIPVSPGTADFYLYFGNAVATSLSNDTNTFIFHDDFSVDLSKWNTIPAGWVIDTGRLKGNSSADAIALIGDYGNLLFEAVINMAVDANIRRTKVLNGDASIYNCAWMSFVANQVKNVKTGEVAGAPVAYALAALTDYTVKLIKAGADWYLYMNGALQQTQLNWQDMTTAQIRLSAESVDVTYWDNVLVRSYISPEPTLTSWGVQEEYYTEYGISQLKQLAAGMAKGDMLYSDGTILAKISPSSIGTNLIAQDPGNPPVWGYPP